MDTLEHRAEAVERSTLPARLRALRDGLLTGLVERDVAVRLALLAALAGEHLLLVGPPGTAKSLIARRLRLAFDQATYFERLLTRFTVPEELFGPLSIKGLEEDRYERLTASYLPTASIAFLDEIFKANSAILNALLTLLNEREFDNGVRREATPLIAVIGASNELPEEGELDALFDRFLLRLHVGPVSFDAFPELLGLRGESAPSSAPEACLTAAEVAAVQAAAQDVVVPDDVVAMLCELRSFCIAEGIEVSDRRWRKVVSLLQVAALTNGREEVSVWDGWLLQHCLWNDPEDREKVYEWYAARVGASAAMDASRLTRLVTVWEARLKQDQESRSQARDGRGRLLYRSHSGEPTTDAEGQVQARRAGERLFLAPPSAREGSYYNARAIRDRTNAGRGYTVDELNQLYVHQHGSFQHWARRDNYLNTPSNWLMKEQDLSPFMEPTRHKPSYVDGCLGDLDAARADVLSYRARLSEHVAALEREVRGHLWVTSDFLEPAGARLGETCREVDTLLARIEKVREGFELLPREYEVQLVDEEGEEQSASEADDEENPE